MNNLYQDIFSNIKEYLDYNEFLSLCYLNKNNYNECKKIKFLKLNSDYSSLYYYSEEFRNKVLNCVISKYQLSLKLIKLKDKIIDANVFKGIHTLEIIKCKTIKNIHSLSNLHTLKIVSNPISDVSSLGKIHYLTLASCNRIDDVSSLSNVNKLALLYCSHIRDCSMLNNVKKLKVIACDCDNIYCFNFYID